jgi:hypothetical protein
MALTLSTGGQGGVFTLKGGSFGGSFRAITTPPPPPPILDTYPGATFAYSLRKLRTAYSGDAIRVRRSSDNTEQNIGFTAAGELDTTALTTFVGANNGFVTIWYDQSENLRNSTQITTTNQPQIVSSGNIILQNGKATLSFDGTSDRLDISTFSFNINALSIIILSKSNSSASNGFALANPDPFRLYAGYILSSTEYFGYNDSATKFNLGIANTNQSLKELYAGSSTANAYRNSSSSVPIATSSQVVSSQMYVGSYNGINSFYNGNIQEIILYTSNQSSNRTGIESNINSHYTIY